MTETAATVREVVIRFPQVDPAGIVFYPRYFEMVSRYFPDSGLTTPPVGIKTQFLKPNRFGDRVALEFVAGDSWSVHGRMQGSDYFSMTPIDVGELRAPGTSAYQGATEAVGRWCAGDDGRLQLSRYFELLNMAIEEWFEQTLGLPFAELHVGRKVGIPTVQFETKVSSLPAIGEEYSIRIRPVKVGSRSLTFTSWLVVDDRCLVENRQVVVFVRMLDDGYESVEIPADIRTALEAQAASGQGEQ
jgi:4-hydroxybenzoyl-CoA thioesterase